MKVVCEKHFAKVKLKWIFLVVMNRKVRRFKNCLVCTVHFIAEEVFSKFKFERYFWVSHKRKLSFHSSVSGAHVRFAKGPNEIKSQYENFIKFFGVPFNKSKCLFIQSFVEQNLIMILRSLSQQSVAMLLSDGSTNDKPFSIEIHSKNEFHDEEIRPFVLTSFLASTVQMRQKICVSNELLGKRFSSNTIEFYYFSDPITDLLVILFVEYKQFRYSISWMLLLL